MLVAIWDQYLAAVPEADVPVLVLNQGIVITLALEFIKFPPVPDPAPPLPALDPPLAPVADRREPNELDPPDADVPVMTLAEAAPTVAV